MDLLSLPRHAVAGYIKLARLPLDTTVKLAGRGERGKLVVDRAGAAARDVAGATLGDDELRRDAQLRRAATDERERAHDLRDAAEQRERDADEQRERDADERYAERKQTAAGRRRQASQRAGPKRRTAEQRHDANRSQVRKTARARKAATDRATASKQDAIDARAKRQRLSTLDRTAEALERRDAAVTAQDEAKRLGDAAARAKAKRKS
ncbi:MAG TPA: hypothetical protein VI006_17080 [Solirubrobacteraceae bacterium]